MILRSASLWILFVGIMPILTEGVTGEGLPNTQGLIDIETKLKKYAVKSNIMKRETISETNYDKIFIKKKEKGIKKGNGNMSRKHSKNKKVKNQRRMKGIKKGNGNINKKQRTDNKAKNQRRVQGIKNGKVNASRKQSKNNKAKHQRRAKEMKKVKRKGGHEGHKIDKETSQIKRKHNRRKQRKKIKKNPGNKLRKTNSDNNQDKKWRKNRRKNKKNAQRKKLIKNQGKKGKKIPLKRLKIDGKEKRKWQKIKNKKPKLPKISEKLDQKDNREENLGCNDAKAAQGISDSIYSYRKYFNHYKKINRTRSYIDKLDKKSQPSKLEQYTKAAGDLKKVTNEGTTCPGDPSQAEKVKELVKNLTKCAHSTDGPIVIQCNKNKIDNHANLDKQDPCAVAYGKWNNAFQICFNKPGSSPPGINPKTCQCYISLNGNGVVPNDSPYSCEFPNQGGKDWINIFSVKAKAVLAKCRKEEHACKALLLEALSLASTCGGKSSSSGSTGKSKRRLALLRNQLRNKIVHY